MAQIIDLMKYKNRTPDEVSYDNKWVPPWHSYLTPFDVDQLRGIAISKRLSGRVSEKMKLIKNIMANRGFTRLAGGTNRVVFRHYEDPRIVCKVALDSVGMSDNPAEYENQWYIRPFCAKTYSISPCGTVAISERVVNFTSIEDFASVSDLIFDITYFTILGKYIMEDIGTKYFMNWGIRAGFGPVLLDYPYIYELDGAKLICDNVMPNGLPCGGEIDYDSGFNELKCKRCGRTYLAREMQKHATHNTIIIDKGGKIPMNVKIKKGNEIVGQSNKCDYIVQTNRGAVDRITRDGTMKVTVRKGKEIIGSNAETKDKETFEEAPKPEPETAEPVEVTEEPTEEKVDVKEESEPEENIKRIVVDDRIELKESVTIKESANANSGNVPFNPGSQLVNNPNSSTNRQVIGTKPASENKQVIGGSRARIPMRSNFIPDEGDY